MFIMQCIIKILLCSLIPYDCLQMIYVSFPRSLHNVVLEYGAEGRAALVTGAVERCNCPPGGCICVGDVAYYSSQLWKSSSVMSCRYNVIAYSGELCAFGWRQYDVIAYPGHLCGIVSDVGDVSGYSGLSCESCERGYRRVNNTVYGGVCLPCDCNGHVDSCDPFTGACGVSYKIYNTTLNFGYSQTIKPCLNLYLSSFTLVWCYYIVVVVLSKKIS